MRCYRQRAMICQMKVYLEVYGQIHSETLSVLSIPSGTRNIISGQGVAKRGGNGWTKSKQSRRWSAKKTRGSGKMEYGFARNRKLGLKLKGSRSVGALKWQDTQPLALLHGPWGTLERFWAEEWYDPRNTLKDQSAGDVKVVWRKQEMREGSSCRGEMA